MTDRTTIQFHEEPKKRIEQHNVFEETLEDTVMRMVDFYEQNHDE